MKAHLHTFKASPSPAAAIEAADIPWNALHLAAENGDARLIRTLLELDADVDARDERGQTALILAIKHRQLKAAAELIAGGASLNAETKDGWTPLSVAVKTGSPFMVNLVVATTGGAAKS